MIQCWTSLLFESSKVLIGHGTPKRGAFGKAFITVSTALANIHVKGVSLMSFILRREH